MGGAEEEGAVFGVAGLIEAKHGQFVAGGGGAAVQQVLDGAAEGVGDAADIFAELAGAVGFPLRDCAAADIAGGGEGILGEASRAPELAYAGADGGGGGFHEAIISEKI